MSYLVELSFFDMIFVFIDAQAIGLPSPVSFGPRNITALVESEKSLSVTAMAPGSTRSQLV